MSAIRLIDDSNSLNFNKKIGRGKGGDTDESDGAPGIKPQFTCRAHCP